MALRVCCDLAHRGRSLQRTNIETPGSQRKTLIKQDQSKQQDKTADRQIDRNFPCRCDPVFAAPDSD